MEGSKIGLLVTRILQLLCAAVVLGLSVPLYRNIHLWKDFCDQSNNESVDCDDLFGRWPSTLGYSAFVGAFGIFDALVGGIAAFASFVPFIVALGIDTVAAIFFLAGGINFAVLYGKDPDRRPCGEGDHVEGCTKFTTDTAFMFIGLLATIVAAAMMFIARRSGSIRSGV